MNWPPVTVLNVTDNDAEKNTKKKATDEIIKLKTLSPEILQLLK